MQMVTIKETINAGVFINNQFVEKSLNGVFD